MARIRRPASCSMRRGAVAPSAETVLLTDVCAKAIGFHLSVSKPPERMNAQTMLPREPFPRRRGEYPTEAPVSRGMPERKG